MLVHKINIMFKYSILVLGIIFFSNGCSRYQNINIEKDMTFFPPINSERIRLFDEGWRFSKIANEDAIDPGFYDKSWRVVDLPHDWSIEDLSEGTDIVGPFSKEKSQGGLATGFVTGGIGYYRKTFSIHEKDKEKIFTIYFDGVYMESDVWCNGHHLGFHPNGYTPFYYELTDYLNPPGEENVLVVRAKNIGKNSRWYSGSGIYRHVWLRVTKPVNIPIWGVAINTLNFSKNQAEVGIEFSVRNQGSEDSPIVIRQEITEIGVPSVFEFEEHPIKGKESLKYFRKFLIDAPKLWTMDSPNLYTLRTEIIKNGVVVDTEETKFGIRTLDFSPEKGFLLNGEPVILKGACIHHDNGILGSASYDRAEQRKIEILKRNGFNAIRSSHNPPSQQLLDACDRLGVLVIDELFDCWEHHKMPNDYHRYFKNWWKQDIQSTLLRDRNHPSIIAWSYGNEIYERADSSGIRIAKQLISSIKEIDVTRPVTQAICLFWQFDNTSRPWSDNHGAFELMDIHGYNYEWRRYQEDHQKFPERVIVGTETFPLEVYDNYQIARDHPYVIGDFVWTGMDYLGEAGLGNASIDSTNITYPWFISNCGDIDIVGFKKPQSYYRDVVWGNSNLEVAVEKPLTIGHKWVISRWGWRIESPCWNWDDIGQELDVYAYSQAEKVEVYLNNKLVTKQIATDTSKYVFHFKVPYEPGELVVIAYSKNKEVARKLIKTTKEVSDIALIADRNPITANINDLCYVEVSLVDSDGNLVRNDDRVIHFEIKGSAKIIAVGNGNPTEIKSFQSDSCKSFNGKCVVVLQPLGKTGKVELSALANHLPEQKLTININ